MQGIDAQEQAALNQLDRRHGTASDNKRAPSVSTSAPASTRSHGSLPGKFLLSARSSYRSAAASSGTSATSQAGVGSQAASTRRLVPWRHSWAPAGLQQLPTVAEEGTDEACSVFSQAGSGQPWRNEPLFELDPNVPALTSLDEPAERRGLGGGSRPGFDALTSSQHAASQAAASLRSSKSGEPVQRRSSQEGLPGAAAQVHAGPSPERSSMQCDALSSMQDFDDLLMHGADDLTASACQSGSMWSSMASSAGLWSHLGSEAGAPMMQSIASRLHTVVVAGRGLAASEAYSQQCPPVCYASTLWLLHRHHVRSTAPQLLL